MVQLFLRTIKYLFVVSNFSNFYRYEQGTVEALQLAAAPNDQSGYILQMSARVALKAIHGISLVLNSLYPHFGVSLLDYLHLREHYVS